MQAGPILGWKGKRRYSVMDGTHLRAVDVATDLDRLLDSTDETLVVASNRQPYRHSYGEDGAVSVDRPTGGLTAGIDEVMRRLGGTWIAWGDGDADEDVVDEDGRVTVPPDEAAYELQRLWLSDAEVEEYYYRSSNQVLWPICHAALGTVEPCGDAWERYRQVNDQFARAVAAEATDGALVWLQDYHLSLTPRIVRERASGDPFLAHSWHIPWPSWDTFRACPHREEIVRGLLGNDLLGFHVPRYCRNFMNSAAAALPDVEVDREAGRIHYHGGTTAVRAFPMGVPAARIEDDAAGMEAAGFREAFTASKGIADGTTIAIGVDRLDYTKGIPERLAALEYLFETRPHLRGEVTYVQVGSESRSWIGAYAQYQERVEERVAAINDRFGTDSWQPVVYTTDHLSNEALAGLYRAADLAIVSPIRDGMNLVAQEYVAAQAGEDTGVLVLSDQAGVHDELGQWTVSVRPHDTTGFADAIEAALTMPTEERRWRCDALREYVFDNDVDAWLRDVIATVQTLRDGEVTPTNARH